jgi:hypothetical protein
MVGIFRNVFLLVALVIVYLVITYVPISGAPKGDWQSRRDDRFPKATPKQVLAHGHNSSFVSR